MVPPNGIKRTVTLFQYFLIDVADTIPMICNYRQSDAEKKKQILAFRETEKLEKYTKSPTLKFIIEETYHQSREVNKKKNQHS